MTHKTKECLSRPRAKGARWTGKNIQADEVVQDVKLGWDAKRDRWIGYDAQDYLNVTEEYEELERLKRRRKSGGEADSQRLLTEDGEDGHKSEKEDAKYAEETDMGRQQSTATRNLRLREDTAKYLLNLDLDSAKYDPKTRSMLDMGAQADQASALVAEDNFMRASGDAAEFEKAQKYAWESQERGDKNKVHVQANPTSGEYFLRKEKEEREAKQEAKRRMLLEKYGGESHLQPSQLRNMAVVENERYVSTMRQVRLRMHPRQRPSRNIQRTSSSTITHPCGAAGGKILFGVTLAVTLLLKTATVLVKRVKKHLSRPIKGGLVESWRVCLQEKQLKFHRTRSMRPWRTQVLTQLL